mmetsp:Transcript_13030/g.18203  ORF Transcript_13030/g.18203 Transcript_13030/m.18203 type:complete len:665 (+) Transcript_13030:1295-3289(+)
MWWANSAALELWNADSLESLLNRDFAVGMSESSERRLAEYLCQFQKGEKISDQWTFHPNGKGPTTVSVTMSGIHIEDGRLAMLVEGVPLTWKEEIDQSSLRTVEMVRHLPIAVCQFNRQGNIMYQNPEASHQFSPGCCCDHKEDEKNPADQKKRKQEKESICLSSSSSSPPCEFLRRFLDKKLGQKVLKAVQDGNDYRLETQQHTNTGPKWFAIKVRRSTDPITAEDVILYSARNISEVIRAKNEAEQLNMEKSEFMAIMAHEIRTPLHQVVGFIELLAQTVLTKEQTGFVTLLQSSAVSLMSVINDLLDFTKLEAGKMTIEKIPFDTNGVVEGSLAVIEPKAEDKGLVVDCHIAQDIPEKIVGDPNRLRQILLNLLQNATKFTNDGSISLSVSRLKDSDKGQVVLRFVVEDTGIGICSSHQNQIFQKYQQGGASTARQFGGTGLGLAICKILADLMGGSIGLDSELGHGSKFWLEVPFEVPPKKLNIVSNRIDIEEVNSSSRRILVAEDNAVNQKMAVAMLKRMGHEAVVVDNGQQAVDHILYGSDKFDLILMDVQMPVMDGNEATKQIRAKGWTRNMLPIVGLTADYRSADEEFYRSIGMNDCIGKPVRMRNLKAAIHRVIAECALESNNNDNACAEGDPTDNDLHDRVENNVATTISQSLQ